MVIQRNRGLCIHISTEFTEAVIQYGVNTGALDFQSLSRSEHSSRNSGTRDSKVTPIIQFFQRLTDAASGRAFPSGKFG